MGQKKVDIILYRPNRALLATVLPMEEDRMVAVVVRLAWQLGLRKQEIHQLM